MHSRCYTQCQQPPVLLAVSSVCVGLNRVFLRRTALEQALHHVTGVPSIPLGESNVVESLGLVT